MNQPVEARGLKFRIGKWRVRIWRYGFEYDDGMRGKMRFFPWAPKPRY